MLDTIVEALQAGRSNVIAEQSTTVSLEQAGAALGLSVMQVQRRIEVGRLAFDEAGGQVRIPQSEVFRLQRTQEALELMREAGYRVEEVEKRG